MMRFRTLRMSSVVGRLTLRDGRVLLSILIHHTKNGGLQESFDEFVESTVDGL